MVKTCKNLTNDFSFKNRYVKDIIFPEHRFANARFSDPAIGGAGWTGVCGRM
mgnify:CR=1 FL=1